MPALPPTPVASTLANTDVVWEKLKKFNDNRR
jgi:hypothetical protein